MPSAYTGQLSYGPSESTPHNPLIYDANADSNQDVVGSGVAEVDSVKVDSDDEKGDGKTSTGAKRSSLLIFLKDSRIYVRVLAIVIMIISLSLILIAVVQFAQAKKKPGHPLDAVPKPSSITDYPCIVFSGVAAMNLVLSISLFVLSCVSSKVLDPVSKIRITSNKLIVQQERQCFQCSVCYPQRYRICYLDGSLFLPQQADQAEK